MKKYYPCNSILAERLCKLDDPVEAVKPKSACRKLRYTLDQATHAAKRILRENKGADPRICESCPKCDDGIEIQINCDDDAKRLFAERFWHIVDTDEDVTVLEKWVRGCENLCETTIRN